MQTTSALWKSLWDAGARAEWRVRINDTDYEGAHIVRHIVSASLVSGSVLEVGACVSTQLELELWGAGDVPRNAEIRSFVRLTDGEQTSEWLPYGVYFVDTRARVPDSGTVRLSCYDAMLKAEQTFLAEGDTGTWPRTMTAVVETICERMGVELDARTTLKDYGVDYPNDLTMREILGYIAAAHGGNWTITPAGALRLVTLGSSGDAIALGQSVKELDVSPGFEAWTGVTIWYDDENAVTTGTDAGRTLELDCPWATQTMASELLASLSGVTHTPFEATGALLDPASELGDSVTIDGTTGRIFTVSVRADALFTADLSAPGEEEVDHEYPYLSPQERALRRTVKLGQSYYGTSIDRESGLTIQKVNPLGGTETRAVLNSDTLAFYDENGTPVLYFDPTTGKYKFVGDVTVQKGSININDKFIVDEDGNVAMSGDASIFGGRYYAGSPDDEQGYSEMTSTGFRVVNDLGEVKLTLGYVASNFDYPYVELGSGDGTSGTKGLLKKFQDGLWIGNDAAKSASGTFTPRSGYIGLFFRFSDNKAYVVGGTSMVNIYTGDAIARFG